MREKSLHSGYSIFRIKPEECRGKAFDAFTPEEYLASFEGVSPYHDEGAQPLIIAVETSEGEAVGIAIASYHKTFSISELHFLHLVKEHRSNRLIGKLLNCVEEELASERARIVSYLSTFESEKELQHQLLENNWAPPKLYMIRSLFRCQEFDPEWLQKERPLPPPFALFPWSELTASQRQQLLKEVEQGRIQVDFTPFQDEENLQAINSLGLKRGDEVIGWMQTHTFPDKKDTIRYTSLYLAPEFRYSNYGICLLAAAIKLQKASPIAWSYFEVEVASVETIWKSFVKKKLIPYAAQNEYIYRMTKMIYFK